MSEGQPDQSKGLVPLYPNKVVTTEEHAANQRKIAQIRQMAASMEQSNDQAHQRFIQLELQRRVEDGERARQMLATMSQAANSPTAISLNPDPFVAGLATGQTGYQGAQSQLHIIPSTARIEEISGSNPLQASQHVGGPSTIPVSANTSASWMDISYMNQPTSNGQLYGGQARNASSSNFGEVMQGRWQTNQPQVRMQQQQPPAQAQEQTRRRAQQHLSQQQRLQQQRTGMQQSQQQQQQPPQQPQPQQRYAQPQTISYGQTSTTLPYSSQSLLPGHMYSGQGSTRPQVATIPATNTSSLEGALGSQGSRASSSSSHRATRASSVQPKATLQNTAQGPPASTQKRQSMDKDVIAADVIQRMGPNYISNMVATAQANSSATVPKPPTRENRAVAAAASQTLPGSYSTSQSPKAESLVNLEPRAAASPAQVLSNTRHIVAQRPSATAPAPAPPTIPVPSAIPASLHAHQANSNAPPTQPLASNGASSTVGYGPTTASTAPFPMWPPPSTTSTQPSSSTFQSTASAQPQFVAPIAPTSPDVGLNWSLYATPGNESRLIRGGYQPGPPGSWGSQRRVPATMAPSGSDGQGLAARAPMTPTNQQLQTGSSPRTPASADKKHLARDILRSLGGSRLLSGKRKRSEEPPAATKRTRPLGAEQSNSDIHNGGSMSYFQSNFALSDQQPAGDVLPIHTSALRREEEEDDDEIELVEDMTSFPLAPISGSSRISDGETQNLRTKPIKPVPIEAPAPSPFPGSGMVSSKPKEPLFLPSPSSSPRSTRSLQHSDGGALTREDDNPEIEAPWDMPSMDVSAEQPFSLESRKRGKIRMEPIVFIPSPPDWVKRAKLRSNKAQNSNRQLKRNNPKRKPWIMEDEVVGDSEHEIDEIEGWDVRDGETSQRRRGLDTKEADEQRRQAEATEREVMSLTSSLLRKQLCKWRNCDVVMNTVDKLSQHVALHGQNKPGPYICLWEHCVRRFSEKGRLLAHLDDTHVRTPVPCPYQDCDLTYKTPRGLVTHCLSEHDGDTRRPSSIPFKPTLLDMPPVPLKLPSYMVVPRDIRQAHISKGRHALLGPWVLRNIFGPVSLEVKRPNAAVPLRSVRGQIDREDSTPQTIANDEYDFLRPKSPSSTPKVRFDDLPSAAVSRLVHGGLVFWGPEVNVKKEPDLLDVVEPLDSPQHGDPPMADGDYQASSALAETLTERRESLSAPDAETDDRLTAIDRQPDQQGELEGHVKLVDDASCLVA